MKKTLASLVCLALLNVTAVSAQIEPNHTHVVGANTDVWSFAARTNHHNAVVRVSVGNASGTGTIVRVNRNKPRGSGFEGYCLTAYHIVRDLPVNNSIKVHYLNGKTAKNCRVVAYDKEFDAALLWVWVPANFTEAKIAKQPVRGRDRIEICGLGGNSRLKCCLRIFNATTSLPTTENQLYADVSLLPGDSGGPVFNQDGHVVGVISGGWFWWDARVRDRNGGHVMATWPARAANGKVILKLIAEVDRGVHRSGAQPEMEQVANK